MQMGTETLEIILRLFFSMISGGIIGYERSSRGIDAGFRTHILVCMSSCAVMLTNIHMYTVYGTGDPTRMPAQVISGVGFLGAGCILVTKMRIKGVTTAAGLWSSACLGLCLGAGNYIVAVSVLVMAYLTLRAFHMVDKRVRRNTRNMQFYVEMDSASDLSSLLRSLHDKEMKIENAELVGSRLGSSFGVVISLHMKKASSVEVLLRDIEHMDGVVYVTEI